MYSALAACWSRCFQVSCFLPLHVIRYTSAVSFALLLFVFFPFFLLPFSCRIRQQDLLGESTGFQRTYASHVPPAVFLSVPPIISVCRVLSTRRTLVPMNTQMRQCPNVSRNGFIDTSPDGGRGHPRCYDGSAASGVTRPGRHLLVTATSDCGIDYATLFIQVTTNIYGANRI